MHIHIRKTFHDYEIQDRKSNIAIHYHETFLVLIRL